MAKDESLARDTRSRATCWLSQEAAAAATEGLEELAEDEDGDRAVRRTAVFALSQRPRDEGVPVLIRLAKSSADPDIRTQALFWLGQSDDPRAIALFEEILTGG
jgi:HEAT repeat protein